MNSNFIREALDVATLTYQTIGAIKGPESAAAFGVACATIQEKLNVNLATAAALLRAELDRRGL